MAQTATIHSLTIDLADLDRGVYKTLELRVARHPSETAEYMLTRVLAYCLEYQEGMCSLSVTGGEIYLSIGGCNFTLPLDERRLESAKIG